MNLKEAIKAYLDGQVKQDAALAEKYAPEHIELCIDYIHDMAEKDLDGETGAVEDAVVYKWARDFWLEGHLEDALKKKEEDEKEREEKRQKEKLAGKAKKTSVKKKDKDGKKAEGIADKAAEVPPEKSAKKALEKFLNEFDAKKLFAKKSRKAMRRAA